MKNKGYIFIALVAGFLTLPFFFGTFAYADTITLGSGSNAQAVFSGKGTRFIPTTNFDVCTVTVYGYTQASTSDIATLNLRNDGTHLDSGSILSTATDTWSTVGRNTGNPFYALEFSFPTCQSIASGTPYWFQITGESIYFNNMLYIGPESGATYENVNSGYNVSPNYALYMILSGSSTSATTTLNGASVKIKKPISGIYQGTSVFGYDSDVIVEITTPDVSGTLTLYYQNKDGTNSITLASNTFSGLYKDPDVDFDNGLWSIRASFSAPGYAVVNSNIVKLSVGNNFIGFEDSVAFFATSTDDTVTCEKNALGFLTADGWKCAVKDVFSYVFLDYSTSSLIYIRNQFMRITDMFPFVILFDAVDITENTIDTVQASSTTTGKWLYRGNEYPFFGSSSAMRNQFGTAYHSDFYDLQENFFWLCGLCIAIGMAKKAIWS